MALKSTVVVLSMMSDLAGSLVAAWLIQGRSPKRSTFAVEERVVWSQRTTESPARGLNYRRSHCCPKSTFRHMLSRAGCGRSLMLENLKNIMRGPTRLRSLALHPAMLDNHSVMSWLSCWGKVRMQEQTREMWYPSLSRRNLKIAGPSDNVALLFYFGFKSSRRRAFPPMTLSKSSPSPSTVFAASRLLTMLFHSLPPFIGIPNSG